MRKFAIFIGVLMLSACTVHMGGEGPWPGRKDWVESFMTLPITFYDTDFQVAKTELVTQRTFPTNKILSATVGYSVVDDKTSRKILYAKEVLQANENGGLVSIAAPVLYQKAQQVDLLGEVEIDKVRYALIPTGEKDIVALVNNQGELYGRIGKIKNDRLTLLTSTFTPYPENFKMVPMTATKVIMTSPVKGYDIKYGGIKGDYITFLYYRYDVPSNDGLHDSGEFEVISYPKQKGLIDIRGVKLRIINIRKDVIEYMILAK